MEIAAFNKKDTILFISSYPEKGVTHSSTMCAVSSYTKQTVQALSLYGKKRGGKKKYAVLTITTEKEELYKEDGILIWRIFQRNNPLSYRNLWESIRKFDRVTNVLVQFEFASFGDTFTTALFPLTLIFLRLLRKRVTLVLHQVVSDISSLHGHVGWDKKGIKITVFNILLRAFTFLLCLPPHTIIVLEQHFKKRLATMVGMEEKIHVVSHGVASLDKQVRKMQARKLLGMGKNDIILLYFGNITWYKGADFLVRTFANNNVKVGKKRVRLIIAGGESRTQRHKHHYQKYLHDVYAVAKKAASITITGFIPEKEIPYYFAACDLVVLPYRTFISSSGPLSLACSFGKPFIMASSLRHYCDSSDFSSSLKEAGLTKKDLFFSLTPQSFLTKLASFRKKSQLESLAAFSKKLREKRAFSLLNENLSQVSHLSLRGPRACRGGRGNLMEDSHALRQLTDRSE